MLNGILQAMHFFLHAVQSAASILAFFFSPLFSRIHFHRGWNFRIHVRVEKSRASGRCLHRSTESSSQMFYLRIRDGPEKTEGALLYGY